MFTTLQTATRKWLPLFVLSAAIMIVILDTTLLTVSMREIAADINTDFTGVQWIITGYTLVLAAFTITGGRLGDIYGHKRMFILGSILFGVGSFITSISADLKMILIGEALIEGLGAALMLPATSSLILSNYRGGDRSLAYGIWGGMAAVSAVLGPLIGGIITTYFGWRWGFRINIIVVLLLLIGIKWVTDKQEQPSKPGIDFVGVGLSATGLVLLVFGIIETSRHGWFLASTGNLSVAFIMILSGCLIMLIFAWWQVKRSLLGRATVLDRKLFSNNQFTFGIAVMTLFTLAMVGILFGLTLFIQSSLKLNALRSGLALLPVSVAVLAFAPLSSYLTRRSVSKIIIQWGIAIAIVSSVVIYFSISRSTSLISLAPGLSLLGAGAGLVVAQLSNLTLSAVSLKNAGAAAGVNNTFRQIGTTIGLALVGTILVSTITASSISRVRESNVIPGFIKSFAVQEINELRASGKILEASNQRRRVYALPSPIRNEIRDIAYDSLVQGMRNIIIIMGLVMALALFMTRFLPNYP